LLFQKEKPLLGLDIGSSSIKLIQLNEARGRLKLERFGIMHLPPELIVDGTVMDSGSVVETIKELFEEQKTKIKDVALSVSGHSVIVKKIILPPMSEEELAESIKFEAQYMSAKQDFGSWAFALLEYSIAPKWSFALSDMYNIDPTKTKKLHYPRVDVVYVRKTNRFGLSYIKQVEGVVCAGGICRLEPAFSGIRFSLNSTF